MKFSYFPLGGFYNSHPGDMEIHAAILELRWDGVDSRAHELNLRQFPRYLLLIFSINFPEDLDGVKDLVGNQLIELNPATQQSVRGIPG